MNLKQCKRIRNQLRVLDVDPKQVAYEYNEAQFRSSGRFSRTMYLVKTCGRWAYKQLKKTYRGGNV